MSDYTMTITPPFLQHQVTQLLDWHRADAHDVEGAEVVNDHDVQVEAVPETDCKPVPLRGCRVGQFKSFHMAWDLYAEKYRSQLKEQHGEVDELRLNYLLNYELLSSIPAPMEKTIYRARAYMVDMVPMATLLLEIHCGGGGQACPASCGAKH